MSADNKVQVAENIRCPHPCIGSAHCRRDQFLAEGADPERTAGNWRRCARGPIPGHEKKGKPGKR